MKKTQSLNRMLHLAGLPIMEAVECGGEFEEAAELAQKLIDTLQDIIDSTEFVEVQDKAELLKGKVETIRREMCKVGDTDIEEKVADEMDRADEFTVDGDSGEPIDDAGLGDVDDAGLPVVDAGDTGAEEFEMNELGGDVEQPPAIDVPPVPKV